MKDVLTTGEIAKLCGVNFRTVIRWIDKGYIEAYKLPGRGDNRVTRENVIKFMRANDMPIPPELGEANTGDSRVETAVPEVAEVAKEQASRRVLIVEDDELMARSMERTLARAGYLTAIASNGIEAGIQLESHKPAAITLDLQMPGMSGFELLEVIRGNACYGHIKILVVSAAGKARETELRALGADNVLDKPFKNKELLSSLKALIAD